MNPIDRSNSSFVYNSELGYHFGGLFRTSKDFTKQKYLQIGVSFSQRRFGSQLFEDGPNLTISASNVIREINIPFLWSKEIDFDSYKVVFRGGVAPGIMLLYRSKLQFFDVEDPFGNSGPREELNRINPNRIERLNVVSGIGVFKKVGDRQIGLMPEFQYNVFPYLKTESIGPVYWSYGLSFLVR